MTDKRHVVRILPNGVEIEEDLYQELIRQIYLVASTLRYGKVYRIHRLVMPEFWCPQPRSIRLKLGRCLAYLEQEGLVPLVFVGCPRCSVKYYRRK